MWQTFRKFGLEYCDLQTMIWNLSVFLRPLTLNIDSKYKKGIPLCFYIITILSLLCYFYVYLFSVLWFVFIRSMQTGELVGAMVVLSLGISSEIGTVKLLYMFFYIEKIRKITDDYLKLDSQMISGSRLSVNVLKYLRHVKKRAIFYWVVLNGNATLYVIQPTFRPGKHLTEDYFVIYGLEPMFESPNYEFAWIMMAASVFLICYISANVTGYLIVITGYAECQMLALSEEVTNIWTDAEIYYESITKFKTNDILEDDNRKNKIMNEYVCENVKDIIKQHAMVKTLLSQVEDVFQGAIAIGFILLVLGLISELLGGLENTYLQLPFAFMQVGMDCFLGQRVMDAGLIFERAVYDCQWQNFDKNNMKMVLVMLQISQKTLAISAGGVSKMSFECMMAAMRATYSAYTALRSIVQ